MNQTFLGGKREKQTDRRASSDLGQSDKTVSDIFGNFCLTAPLANTVLTNSSTSSDIEI
jgi:hypothetical protein